MSICSYSVKKPYLIGTLEFEEHVFKYENNTLKVVKGSSVVTKGTKRNRMYYLVGDTITSQDIILFTVIENKSSLWHNRTGYIGNNGLKSLSN